MSEIKIFSIHGYKGSAQNSVYSALADCGYKVHSVQIDYDSESPKNILEQLHNEYIASGCNCLVGTSLGGFYAAQICVLEHCPTLFINPCLMPFIVLLELGYSYSGGILEFSEMFSGFTGIDKSVISTIVGSEDEVVTTHHYTKAMFENDRYYTVNGGKHSGATLPLREIIIKHGKEIFPEG